VGWWRESVSRREAKEKIPVLPAQKYQRVYQTFVMIDIPAVSLSLSGGYIFFSVFVLHPWLSQSIVSVSFLSQ